MGPVLLCQYTAYNPGCCLGKLSLKLVLGQSPLLEPGLEESYDVGMIAL